mmetsp:Transcript_8461/g.27990  ORF Transcript_8461/g.27990 Transcript_8461/m.27990 type:complete len:207 (+) Transcript_8461:441-1061(+)
MSSLSELSVVPLPTLTTERGPLRQTRRGRPVLRPAAEAAAAASPAATASSRLFAAPAGSVRSVRWTSASSKSANAARSFASAASQQPVQSSVPGASVGGSSPPAVRETSSSSSGGAPAASAPQSTSTSAAVARQQRVASRSETARSAALAPREGRHRACVCPGRTSTQPCASQRSPAEEGGPGWSCVCVFARRKRRHSCTHAASSK